MQGFYASLLNIFHFIYAVILLIRSFWQRNSAPPPLPLRASRPRIPKHLAIVFNVDPTVSDAAAQELLTESVVDSVSWCRSVGIHKLTVYEENELLYKCIPNIRRRLPLHGQESESSDSETEYPITPPASEYSESRPLSPDTAQGRNPPITTILVSDPIPRRERQMHKKLQRRHQSKIADEISARANLLLCFASWRCSKPAIATAAQELARKHSQKTRKGFRSRVRDAYRLSVDELNQILEGKDDGLSSPDFMIIHPIESSSNILAPPELHGFPPWHIRLTEIYQNKPPKSRLQRIFRGKWAHLPTALDETSFRSALDEFTSAEMRFGK
ncbi:hypothetical protein JR316_0001043 [Psilocybe cubensis]|uniref:ditrans,polycis-polyprenyl diphosphate synthase [(2E,6E)-farnesyldiphosphate specific] n=2 Tax=Psilocybe cubensis TaxID=181762 RepID=A0A8H7Y5W6_PSICU|nr:hypothetical protein JR316_0001043 [Psilocybe cubensis]KAH9486977.1 hypothetical protein JR316_0001043 [Psilocybe cubensis]